MSVVMRTTILSVEEVYFSLNHLEGSSDVTHISVLLRSHNFVKFFKALSL